MATIILALIVGFAAGVIVTILIAVLFMAGDRGNNQNPTL